MGKIINELSVFFPTFNEEGNIETVVSRARPILEKIAGKWEIIIVDDGSTDRTSKIADGLAKRDGRIRVIHHKVNLGYGAALKTGFENAKYPWVAFTDADGQFDFSDIKKLITKKDEADLILGYRKKRADSIARKIFTFGWASLARVILGLKAKDYSCGFKMVRKKVYDAVQPLVGEEKVTQIELLVKARKKGFKFAEVGVNHFPRTKGEQTGAKLKVVFKSLLDLFKLWGKIHGVTRRELIIVLTILSVGAFLRLYKIDSYMTFLGDEGRDVIIVRRLLTEGHPPLIGPGTSIGQMYLGPLYYYMMAPALLLANFSPIGPAIQVAILGVITILLVWYAGREWFGKTAGLIASGLYAISPNTIIFSRSSWNPNIMPFFALLTIYSIWKVWKEHEYKWLIILGVAFAFVMQSHYLGLLLIPTITIFYLLAYMDVRKSKVNPKILKFSLIGYGIFLLLMSPLLFFDIRHNWMNSQAIYKFFTVRQETVSIRPWNSIPKIPEIFTLVNTSLVGGKNEIAGVISSIVIFIGAIVILYKTFRSKWDFRKYAPHFLLFFWVGFGLIGFGLYKQQIYDHYFGFIFAVPYLLIGAFTAFFIKINNFTKWLAVIFVGYLTVMSFVQSPLRFSPNKQMQRSQNVSKFILSQNDGKPFNLAVLAERNYEDGYRYFLELSGAKVLHADKWNPETIANTLFVVCEMEEKKCDPTHSPKAEVANFGWSVISDQWTVDGVRLYKLLHSK